VTERAAVPDLRGLVGYLAPAGFEGELRTELGEVPAAWGRLMLAPARSPRPAWCEDVWYAPEAIDVSSPKDAARKLRVRGRQWAPLEVKGDLAGPTRRVAAELPPLEAPPLSFPAPLPSRPLGAFALIEPHRLIASARCESPFPRGEIQFQEDRVGPPSRAYLKLWEALARLGSWPGPSDRCLDLGASPGGWTWALAELGAQVIAVDKAPLDPRVAQRPEVTCRAESAFGLDPKAQGPVDWFFSDVICYPERLLRMVERWLEQGLASRFVCTLKFQGETDHEVARAFAAIPGAQLLHLHHNRHELTFLRLPEPPVAKDRSG
jgi:23S rRNA (cytidine2498-2'-O)-methyltransferase